MGIYHNDYRRDTEIDRLLHAYSSTIPGALERQANDVLCGVQQQVLRDVLRRADKAMQDEGVAVGTRDRVLHRIVCCEPQEATEERLGHRPFDYMPKFLMDLNDLPPETGITLCGPTGG